MVRSAARPDDVTVHDEAFGDVTMPAGELDDFVILKADGFPTFYLANVVDDALMGVTFVMRGQEFLGQTWRHVLLREALGFPEPRYCPPAADPGHAGPQALQTRRRRGR